MAADVTINGVSYSGVPAVTIPKTGGGGDAVFVDFDAQLPIGSLVVAVEKPSFGEWVKKTGLTVDDGTGAKQLFLWQRVSSYSDYAASRFGFNEGGGFAPFGQGCFDKLIIVKQN